MPRRIVRAPQADQDALEIWLYIARDSPEAADRVIDHLDVELSMLATMPGMGARRDELHAGLRSWPVGHYILFYREIEDGIELVRVLHGARDLPRLFSAD